MTVTSSGLGQRRLGPNTSPELTGLEKMTTVRHRKRKTETNEVNAALVWGGISQSESARQRETELDVSVCVCQYVCERNWGEATRSRSLCYRGSVPLKGGWPPTGETVYKTATVCKKKKKKGRRRWQTEERSALCCSVSLIHAHNKASAAFCWFLRPSSLCVFSSNLISGNQGFCLVEWLTVAFALMNVAKNKDSGW